MTQTGPAPSAPGRSLLILGAAGSFFAAAVSVAYAGLVILWSTLFPLLYIPPLGLVLSVLLAVALLLHLFGLLGFPRRDGSAARKAIFTFGVAASLFFLVSNLVVFIQCLAPYACYRGSSLLFLLMPIGFAAFGAMFVAEGAVLYRTVRHTAGFQAARATGVVFVCAGSLLCSVPFLIAGFFVAGVLVSLAGGFLVAAVAFSHCGYVLLGVRGHLAPRSSPGQL